MSKEFTVEDLLQHDGKRNKTIYVALAGNVYDVTEKGAANYGEGGQYSMFAGRDISRAMATMTMTTSDTHDDLGDLSEEQINNLKTWEKTFSGRFIAKLICMTIG